MDISKIGAAIEQLGYNPFGVQGQGEQDAQKLAQQNGISVQEAKEILKEAEQKVQENDKMSAQVSEMMLDLLNQSDEEEEIVIIDDFDFDNFLNEESPEQKMQNIINQQQFAKQDNTQSQQNQGNAANNLFAQNENPFLKMKW